MKNILSLFLALLISGSVLAQEEKSVEAASKITDVTVFLRGAQVTRTANVQLNAGNNVLIFRGLADGIDAKTIQVAAPQDVLINSVVKETNYLKRQKPSPRLQRMEDSLRILKDLMEFEANSRVNLDQEKGMLLKNQSLASEKDGVDIAELEKAANFFRKRLTDIQEQLMALKKREGKYRRSKKRIRKQMKELNYTRNRPSNDIKLTLRASSAKRAQIYLQFLVGNAGWVPNYDLRAKDSQNPIQLDYKADVYQNTGIDWEKVNLKLSSGNPNLGGTQPILQAWNLYVQAPIVHTKGRRGAPSPGYVMDEKSVADESSDDDWGGEAEEESIEEEYWDDSETLADYTSVKEGATTAEFVIGIPQTIATGSKPQQVAVQSSKLPSIFSHYAIPKLDKDAFLVAGVTEWEKLNLLAGKVQIFFEGTYVAESYIDPSYTKDTLDFSMGRDKKVIIQREQLKDFNKTATIGFNRERTFGFDIRIRNTKTEAIQLHLEDQIPVSQDKDITVKLIEKSGADYNEETGKLEWDLAVGPSQTKTIRLIFSVKHPKNKVVPGL